MAIWMMLSYLGFLSYGGFRFYAWVERRKSLHHSYPGLSDFDLLPVGSICLAIAHRGCQTLLRPLAHVIIVRKSKWSNKVYGSKLSRFGSAVFKFSFFVSFTAFSWKNGLAEADWVPPAMFGKGSTKNCWGVGNALDTQQPVGAGVKLSYQIAMAYHFHELFFQVLFEREKPDFIEMLAHHSTTVFLVIMSFYGNMVRMGSLVLLVHYVSDIPGYGCKVFVDTRYKIMTVLNYMALLTVWGYFRVYVLPVFIIRSTLMESTLEHAAFGDVVYWTFNVGLILLLCLNVYWYFMFLRMGYHLLVTGETKDMQANLTSMELKAAKADEGHTHDD